MSFGNNCLYFKIQLIYKKMDKHSDFKSFEYLCPRGSCFFLRLKMSEIICQKFRIIERRKVFFLESCLCTFNYRNEHNEDLQGSIKDNSFNWWGTHKYKRMYFLKYLVSTLRYLKYEDMFKILLINRNILKITIYILKIKSI